MKKADAIARWQQLEPRQDPLPHMIPIPYKASGSTYGACGVRIDGTPEFIDAVLSNLKPLLDGENNVTRLGLVRNPVDGSKLGKSFDNAARQAEVCYIRLHVRGAQGAIVAALCHDHDDETNRYAQAVGVT